MAGLTLFLTELFLHHDLGGNPSMVGAWKPEHFLAFHTGFAGQDVLNRVVEHVARRVQHARTLGGG